MGVPEMVSQVHEGGVETTPGAAVSVGTMSGQKTDFKCLEGRFGGSFGGKLKSFFFIQQSTSIAAGSGGCPGTDRKLGIGRLCGPHEGVEFHFRVLLENFRVTLKNFRVTFTSGCLFRPIQICPSPNSPDHFSSL